MDLLFISVVIFIVVYAYILKSRKQEKIENFHWAKIANIQKVQDQLIKDSKECEAAGDHVMADKCMINWAALEERKEILSHCFYISRR